MVLVDTSVWIALYRGEKTNLGQRMWALTAANEAAVCGQIWVEFLGGFRKEKQRLEFESSLRAFPFLPTSREAYECAAHLLARHPRLGAGDAVIAATALTNDSSLLTLDHDFESLVCEGLDLFA
ncbi:MAG: PIN domain-containing protein [Deltaproteobacteria bacterium]|nr:PIN domain-containing protein [Deltaproteobacteria bacterium]